MNCLEFYKINPSGNITVLLENKNFSKEQMQLLGHEAMSSAHLQAEQVGFFDVAKSSLQMAGGEFCVNATRSLALVLALKNGSAHLDNNRWHGTLQVSGCNEPLELVVNKDESGHAIYNVELHMPLPVLPPMQELGEGAVLVSMEGIKHLLLDVDYFPFVAKNWQQESARMRQVFGLEVEEALGCIWWSNIDKGKKNLHNAQYATQLDAHPVVRITTPLSECYENSCGSGTLALALWHHFKFGSTSFNVQQPGGHLTVLIDDNHTRKAVLGGPVSIIAQGQANFVSV